jgi:superfamily I DNA and/or RNA helicase
MELRQQIATWKEDLLAPNKSDVLANLIEDKNAILLESAFDFEEKVSISQDRLINKLFKNHKDSIKESGTPIFGVSQNIIKFEYQDIIYSSPIAIASCAIKNNRYSKTYEIEQIEPFYLNPFLLKTLDIKEDIQDQEKLEEWLKIKGLSFTIETGQWFANFHPHRFILIKELEQLEKLEFPSSAISEIFGNPITSSYNIDLSEGELFASDHDQIQVYNALKSANLAVQGPPGTGKSQVIANTISKAIANEKSALLVAEKKVALDVIQAKLSTFDLDHFCLLHHHELNAKDFVKSLKSTWEFLEKRTKKNKPFVASSKLAISGLDLTLDRLRQDDLIGGVSFSAFKKCFIVASSKEVPFVAEVPSIKAWENDKEVLERLIEDKHLSKSWTFVKTKNDPSFISDLHKALKRMIHLVEVLSVPEISKNQVAKMMRKSSMASLFFYDDLLIPQELFEDNSKTQKKFLREYDKFMHLKEECIRLEGEKKHWKKSFSLSELQEYISVLSSTSPFNLRSKYYRNKLLKFTDLNLSDAKSVLENLVQLKKKEGELIKVKQQLRKLGVATDINELQSIRYVIRKSQQVDHNLINSLVNSPKKKLVEYKQQAIDLNELNDLAFHYLLLEESDEILPVLSTVLKDLDQISGHLKAINSVSDVTKKIWRNAKSLTELEAIIFNSHWKKFEGRFPELASIDGEYLGEKVEDIANFKKIEHQLFSEQIKDTIQEKFENYHSLLNEPARKLSEEDKQLKKELRKGKSILVKAFGKSRSFPSIHDLLNSEAKKWINLLHPIFLCSPYTVAKSLPIDQNFDLVIFDESSQIPLPHALGGLQRGKRVLVAGDQQQMAPHFYFQKKSSSTHDLLHQASFHFKNFMLTNHYRSSNEQLIAYSNRNFYNDKLTTFPKPNTQQAIEVINTKGRFIDRVNKEEAIISAKEIQTQLKNGIEDLGIVAFSKTQLKAILEELPSDIKDQLLDEQKPGFVQSLENVQGDQCSHLIISMGYAPNEDGDFHMRFGPLNQEQGHRRLNVLMSRAEEKITFIRSVKAKDFSISDNEGVEALRKLMLFLEEERKEVQNVFPENVSISNNNTLEISAPQELFSSAHEMVNYCEVLKARGWKIGIRL